MDDYVIPETDDGLIAECAVQVFRSSGPGGQSVNTTDSAVRLVHRPTGIRVQCQRQRSQLQNKRECLRRLREKLEEMAQPVIERRPTKPSRAARTRRLAEKKRVSQKKHVRRTPPSDD